MKNRALFVDDEPLVLSGLRRMLRSLRHDWDMSFANSGKEALAMLEEQEFTVIVSDMRMPEMDGAALLNDVATRHPAVARFVLSGHAELEAILRAVRPAHQFLAKPCDPKVLEQALHRILQTRLDDRQGAISRKLGAHRRLPSPNQRIDQLSAALQATSVNLEEVGEIVSHDIAMSIQVLRLVNAAFFGPPTKTLDPRRAVSILGADIMRSLLNDVALFRPVLDHVNGGEDAVIRMNGYVVDKAGIIPEAPEIDPRTLAMLSFAGPLAAIEISDPLDDDGKHALSQLLLAYWGLAIDINGGLSASEAQSVGENAMLLGA